MICSSSWSRSYAYTHQAHKYNINTNSSSILSLLTRWGKGCSRIIPMCLHSCCSLQVLVVCSRHLGDLNHTRLLLAINLAQNSYYYNTLIHAFSQSPDPNHHLHLFPSSSPCPTHTLPPHPTTSLLFHPCGRGQ